MRLLLLITIDDNHYVRKRGNVMKNKGLFVLNILAAAFGGVIVVLYLTGLCEISEKNFGKGMVLFLTYFIAVVRYSKKCANSKKNLKNDYAFVIKDAFENDKKSFNKLIDCIFLFNNDKNKKAIKGLKQLFPLCIRLQDKVAVLMFLALCHEEIHDDANAILYYEQLLAIDITNSTAWSNLGMLYKKNHRTDKAREAYQQAIYYDSDNANAYNNMGVYFYQNGEYELAKEYGLKAFQLDNSLATASSLLALSYAALGEAKEAEKYCKIYASHNKDVKALSAMVEKHLQEYR